MIAAAIVFAVLSALANACSAVLQRLAVVHHKSGADLHTGLARLPPPRRHRPRTWSAALTICLGLAAFLVVASPGEGSHVPDAGQWMPAVGTRGLAVLGLLLLGRSGSPARRAASFVAARDHQP